MDYIKTLPLPPPRCRSAPHQLPPASAVCIYVDDLRQGAAGQTPCFPGRFHVCAKTFKTGTIFNVRHIAPPTYIVYFIFCR